MPYFGGAFLMPESSIRFLTQSDSAQLTNGLFIIELWWLNLL